VAWDSDEPSWVNHTDFETYTHQKIQVTVVGLKLDHMIGKRILVDWRGIYNFQSGRVTQKNSNGSFQVHYTDGDVDDIQLHKLPKKSITSEYGQKHRIYEWCVML
jgi:hypothetical protein